MTVLVRNVFAGSPLIRISVYYDQIRLIVSKNLIVIFGDYCIYHAALTSVFVKSEEKRCDFISLIQATKIRNKDNYYQLSHLNIAADLCDILLLTYHFIVTMRIESNVFVFN